MTQRNAEVAVSMTELRIQAKIYFFLSVHNLLRIKKKVSHRLVAVMIFTFFPRETRSQCENVKSNLICLATQHVSYMHVLHDRSFHSVFLFAIYAPSKNQYLAWRRRCKILYLAESALVLPASLDIRNFTCTNDISFCHNSKYKFASLAQQIREKFRLEIVQLRVSKTI